MTGSVSWVRNILVSDGRDDVKVVLWGEKALLLVQPGDKVNVYHATAKPGRYGGIELGVGRGSSFQVPEEESHPIIFEGTIIAGQGCTFIDNGTERYLISGNFPHGAELRVTGILSGNRIIAESTRPVDLIPEILLTGTPRIYRRTETISHTFALRSPREYMPMFNILMCHRRCARNG